MDDKQIPAYFAYWGKAQPSVAQTDRYHLLPYHCLDVAACGRELIRLPQFSLQPLSRELGWPQPVVEQICLALLAIHDAGKFARSFQNLAPDLDPSLVCSDSRQQLKFRHDTLGWVVCEELLYRHVENKRDPGVQLLAEALKIFTGHHGKPPEEFVKGGECPKISAARCFLDEDLAAAEMFLRDVKSFFLHEPLPVVEKRHKAVLRRHGWRLAGLAVLADWLGSDSEIFRYKEQPTSLQAYWQDYAQPMARRAVERAGLLSHSAKPWVNAAALLPHLTRLTPLQEYASEVEFGDGPQLFLLEDVTGAGKTEAALLLCHRLMAAGKASGFYFALPTMATANQMYGRVGSIYRGMFASKASPSLVLAHGAREMVEGFRESVLHALSAEPDADDLPPGPQCNAWIADSRKRALLADVGVGTVDQALLGVLPVRHQSLRLLGLAGKVLVVDEVHAYDAYTSHLLEALVQAQAQGGGSVVLLSATVPATLRERLVEAFWGGVDADAQARVDAAVPADVRYPLATHVQASGIETHTCPTRPEVKRRVGVAFVHNEEEAETKILAWQREGRAVCWIRNTMSDARRSYLRLRERLHDSLHLFHSRFVMGDRLTMETGVLGHFDSNSGAQQRRGQVLIATQVVEQSLDLDFDELIVDLAPIDLLIQRAGRLHRHVRDAAGNRAQGSGRPAPVLHVLAPEFTETPDADWYKALFPKAAYVYADHGRLWLTHRALLRAGDIVTPGEPGQAGSVRHLVEAVYGSGTEEDAPKDGALGGIPAGLQRSSSEAEGKRRSETSMADFNTLKLEKGYCIDAGDWDAADRTPTRLGDETRPVYLAREVDGALMPLLPAPRYAWEQSSVRTDLQRITGLAPEWQARFAAEITRLQKAVPLLSPDAGALLVPVVADGDGWLGYVSVGDAFVELRYDSRLGLML